jgi:hypothetical protein
MRDIPDEMAARIESGAATLCHAWIVERLDGMRLGFTDHDRDLEVDDLDCRAASGWTQGAAETDEGLSAGNLAIGGVLDDARIKDADVAAGLWDRARVELWRVDWARPNLKVRLGVGTLSRIRREGESFVAEMEGPLAALERVVGRTYGRACDAVLGDARCAIDPAGRACDKRWETCVGTFANGVNFQGFPDIPGDDFLTAFPATGGRHDGGSRR